MKRIKRESGLVVNDIRKKLDSNVFVKHCRVSEKDFTRDRKLPFKSLILFMLNIIKQTLQKELTHFVSLFGGEKADSITKSAYCQSRMKLKHTGFIELNDVILKSFYTRCSFKKWNNFIVLGVDGSKLNLPYSEELLKDFGIKLTKDKIMPQAIISSCYDLLNEIIIDSQIDKGDRTERPLALKHIENLHKINHKVLIIFDRGYQGLWFMFYLLMKKVDFVMRLKNDFPEVESFLKSDDISRIINYEECSEKSINQLKKLGLIFHSIKIRLVKVILDDGTIEVLATSLLDEKKYPSVIFKDLYFRRWGIETNFDRLKNKIEVENFTGLSTLSVLQDYYANMFILNLQSIIARDVQSEIDEDKTELKHKYNVNKNLSLGYMKDNVINILTSKNPKYMDELIDLFKIEPNPIRKGRKFPRDFSVSKRKYNINQKKAV
jgi:hypothetical protein